MFFSNIYLGCYAIAWIALLVIYLLKTKKVGLGGMLLITYTVSALTSIVFYNGLGSILVSGEDIEWPPLVYLFICLNICMIPIYVHSKELDGLRFQANNRGGAFIVLFMQLMSPFVLEAFVEILYIAIQTQTTSLGSIYESSEDIVGSHLSFIGRKTMAVCRWFVYIWPIIFFYLYGKGKEYRKYAWIAMLAFLTSILEAYAGASRVGIVRNLMYFFIVFLLFKASLPSNVRKKIVKIITIGLPILVVSLVIITIARFNSGGANENIDIFTWLSLYSGEAPIRFCQYLWNVDVTMNGDNAFGLLKELLGMNPITDLEERREYWEPRLGIPNRIFYSWIGDIYFDFGRVWTVIYAFAFCCILEWYIRKLIKREVYSFSTITIFALIILVLEFGIMYLPFKAYILQILLIPNFLFLIVYNFMSRNVR